MFRQNDGVFGACSNCWGDWSAHTSYMASFAFGRNFPPSLPILAGEKFSYPFLVDLITAGVVKLGVDWVKAMVAVSLVTAVGLAGAVIAFGWKLTGKFKIGVVTALVFFLNGGVGEWQNLISSQVVPQRGLALGMTMAICVYWLLWQKKLFWAGVVAGLLPLVHAHSFMAVVLVAGGLGGWRVIRAKNKTKEISAWLAFAVPALILGGAQVRYFYAGVLGQNFVRWQPGWLAGGGLWGWAWFWLKNAGLVLVLATAGWWLAPKNLQRFSLVFWGLFFLANLVVFQPWDWDNTKMLTHWHLMASVLAAGVIVRFFDHKRWLVKILGVGVLVASVWFGSVKVVAIAKGENQYRFWDKNQIEAAAWVKDNTPPRAVFLTASNHDHWLLPLTGRKIVIGYPGWLWTYGLNYSQREKEVGEIFGGGQTADSLMDKYRVDYVVLGPEEKRLDSINQEYFQTKLTEVYQLEDYQVFAVN
ncbi:MAG: putative membrane protein [Candidatus Beckwithbacteria bacterium GW2011_GWB1_47_15]|uniref:Putative membrane protein n=1 Tax=Candidatus Beckwithbacteria bacterium GW2011_GWB1_47_15 TaxID=1618371 RepID=A0A0G1RWZ7_9BACT|nr:MAG: hypothetical protein UY43_C0001G1070 [Candidatus Beckwithbacteria bacterium GW2011_GWC1_49_16]AQS30693.1 hypothetical protein [uncultured bacterium]KKU35880.1 MAG: putative membrane protein [Candidatus Beckwithbacteria bacterium GW2011_GWA1_46_30]KKU61844.1 MAG: putative membrane protein [Candidatus Beckwithbacteria bacterium GW2011_GWB1_47_15]KKU72602.1 MAG: putative membrane protein [Candidatus Beckwithbacteria bacterium GW2011_GWA2_47_25]